MGLHQTLCDSSITPISSIPANSFLAYVQAIFWAVTTLLPHRAPPKMVLFDSGTIRQGREPICKAQDGEAQGQHEQKGPVSHWIQTKNLFAVRCWCITTSLCCPSADSQLKLFIKCLFLTIYKMPKSTDKNTLLVYCCPLKMSCNTCVIFLFSQSSGNIQWVTCSMRSAKERMCTGHQEQMYSLCLYHEGWKLREC